MTDPKIIDEPARLAALRRYAVLDTPAESPFDEMPVAASAFEPSRDTGESVRDIGGTTFQRQRARGEAVKRMRAPEPRNRVRPRGG